MPPLLSSLRPLFSFSAAATATAAAPPPSFFLLLRRRRHHHCPPPKIPPFFISASSHTPRRPRKAPPPFRRRISTASNPPKPMEEKEAEELAGAGVGFNKRRAEGKEKGDKRRTLQLKTRKLNPVSTISYVQILGTGMDTQDTSPSVLLFFDKQRFIFNAGEGLQRFCTEHKVKLSKIDHIFLTRVCSETAGGLPGLLLTLAGMGDEGMSVNVWGPSDLKYLIDAMTFIPNAAMVHTHKFGPSAGQEDHCSSSDVQLITLVDDEVVKLSAILLRPRYSNLLSTEGVENDCRSSGDCLGEIGTPSKPGDVSVVYACELPDIKGKFDPAKAVALGLNPGPKYRELQLGNSVISDHQNIMVHPSDVLGPSIPGPIILLVDCPSIFHLQEMLLSKHLCDYYVDNDHPAREGLKTVNCLIHLGPATVTSTHEYQNWMKGFGAAQHIMAGHTMKNTEIPILKSSAKIASRLNYLCPQLFPAPGVWYNQNLIKSTVDIENKHKCPDVSESLAAENLLKFHLRPYSLLGLDKSSIPSTLVSSQVLSELLSEIPEIEEARKHVSQFWHGSKLTKHGTPTSVANNIMAEEPWMNAITCSATCDDSVLDNIELDCNIPNCLEDISRDQMEIVLLGTGSSQPSKYRNVSSVYINLFSKGSVLLDCGEGTYAQLKRRFGLKGADDAIKGLICIWISHIHADHHAGLARILSVRAQLLKNVAHEPLLVVGPRQLKRFLDAYSRLEDIDMQYLDCRDTVEASWEAADRGDLTQESEKGLFSKSNRMESYWKRPGSSLVDSPTLRRLKQVLLECGLEALVSVPVIHCPQAFGVVLKAKEQVNLVGKSIPGWKLVYSGDTRPCQALVDASRDATVLIHEATFEDGMMDEAVARNHSTTGEAIEVGSSARAYRIILTHFSQRYPKIPVFDESRFQNTCIAFDMMSINIADLPILPKVVPYLKLLFKDEMLLDDSEDIPVPLMQELS